MKNFLKKFSVFRKDHEEYMSEKVASFFPKWISPNQLTIFRVLLLIPSVLFLNYGWNLVSALICGIALYGDALDGVLARVRNLCTPFGAALDAIMDKVFIVGYLLYLVFTERYFEISYTVSIFFIIIILMVILIEMILGAVRIKDFISFKKGKLEGQELFAVNSGKFKLCLEATGVLGLILSHPTLNFFGYFGLTCLFFSLIFASMSLINKISR